MIEKELENISSAGAKIETMIRINLSGFRKIHEKKGHAFMDGFQYEIASEAFREAFYLLVSEIVEEGVRREEFSVGDIQITIRYVQTLISETVRIIAENNESQPEEHLISAIHKLLDKTD
jgi:hypothetical protein